MSGLVILPRAEAWRLALEGESCVYCSTSSVATQREIDSLLTTVDSLDALAGTEWTQVPYVVGWPTCSCSASGRVGLRHLRCAARFIQTSEIGTAQKCPFCADTWSLVRTARLEGLHRPGYHSASPWKLLRIWRRDYANGVYESRPLRVRDYTLTVSYGRKTGSLPHESKSPLPVSYRAVVVTATRAVPPNLGSAAPTKLTQLLEAGYAVVIDWRTFSKLVWWLDTGNALHSLPSPELAT